MLADALTLAHRLHDLVAEESARLEAGESASALSALTDEKTRLTGELAQMKESMKIAGREALVRAATPEVRRDLQAALEKLDAALIRNGQMLARKKQLSESLMGSVLAEARRVAGTQANVYGAAASARTRAAALSFNSRV